MIDDAFASKDDIAGSVLSQLQHVMKEYGYEIMNTLVTDLSPDARVKASMNEINAARRLKEAAAHKAEADKTKQVKGAEAEAEARYLSGLGVARQRKAIVEVSDRVFSFLTSKCSSLYAYTNFLFVCLVCRPTVVDDNARCMNLQW